ncbi:MULTISPECIES: PDR/VanB family oxidoreductase [unclassified Rhodococcus (in: high G+C Gram-positive bacteria)]|uniref:PDR/VanB family oxidoreductase n=1 Tax=unclassified Rhodococcus (in: high G+C Gram-positive bacteria) TaxID=192944 RepID=UPI0009EC0DB8|nr:MULTISPECIES: PDR/VanB family oxidoreductase [unclassified Rhodococcus (in: high G+C Gram-positive bacteria)]
MGQRRFGRAMEAVREYRASRTIPEDLHGRGGMDEMLAQITDGLDKMFAILDHSEYKARAAPMQVRILDMVVSEKMSICVDENVVGLTFRRADGADVPPWRAGSHLDIELPSGRRRQYSLCGDPRETDAYSIAVRLVPDGGGGSVEMHALEVGDRVSITGPRNAFPFVASGSALFVAGGIGMTAIIPMIRKAREVGMDWHLVYSGRTTESMPFLDEVSTWEQDRVTVRTDAVDGLPGAADLLRDAPDGGSVYCCGPPPMIAVVREGITATSATRLHYERFSAPPVVAGESFSVELARTGTVVDVASDETALDAVRRVRPGVPYSCRQGFCGTCKVRVLAGVPEHRDRRLSDDERADHMLICVSRSAGEQLTLDL